MTRTQIAMLAAFGSFALLGGAFLFQLAGYPPCKMCLWQRWPHAAAIAIGLLFLVVKARVLLWLGAAAAATTGAIGVFHAGVELKWWEGPTSCTSNANTNGLTAEQLLDQILNAPVVRCDDIAWQFLGISMAGWNAVISFALAIIWVIAARTASPSAVR